MSNRTIRLITVLSIVSMLGISFSQTYWIKKALETQDAAFHSRVMIALRNVAREILVYNKNQSQLTDPVVKVSKYEYAIKVNDRIQPELLEGLLKKEFLYAGIKEDFYFKVYDCFGKTITYEKLISRENQNVIMTNVKFPYDNHFFYLKFPFKKQLWDSLHLWLFSTVVVILVILFLGYVLYAVFKQKMLSQIQKDFVNNMTHEFKTPLTSIVLASEILKESIFPHSHQKVQKYVSIINKEASKLENQIERILQVSSADTERISLKKESVEVHHVISKLTDKFKLINKVVFFSLDYSAANSRITADVLHFSNILDNLVDNAIKYSVEDPYISIRTYNKNDKIFISIKDNGIGIETEHQKKIFNNFYRISDRDIQNVKGFGLGLYYVKLLMKIHRGEIKLESKPGIGSEFILSFTCIQ
jgi:two-component system phosphate regulon sensor histidine kinase PhoR